MAEKICGIYRIINTATGDCYIGSSKDVKHRLACHKCPSRWNEHPNCPMYLDMKKYGTDKFEFQILAEAEPEKLKEVEQQFIEKLKPTYNNYNANGCDFERYKEYYKEYRNQLCLYEGEALSLNALSKRFRRRGIPNPIEEAKKYLI